MTGSPFSAASWTASSNSANWAWRKSVGAQAVEPVAEQRQPGGVVLGPPQHEVEQQRLVERRGHLGHEDRVVGGRVGLRLVGQPGVHRVARLVGQRREVVVLPVEVEQLVRVDAVDAGRVGAGALAGGGEEVGPAALVAGAAAPPRSPCRAARRPRAVSACACVGREGEVDLADQRHVEVLVAELRQAEHLLAQLQVAVERRQAAVHVGEQLRVDRGRDVVAEERRLQRAAELAGARREEVRPSPAPPAWCRRSARSP